MNKIWIQDITNDITKEKLDILKTSQDSLRIDLKYWKENDEAFLILKKSDSNILIELKKSIVSGFKDIDFDELGSWMYEIISKMILKAISEVWNESKNLDWYNIIEKIADKVAKLIWENLEENVKTKKWFGSYWDCNDWYIVKLWIEDPENDKILKPIRI